ncbi:hypothetical protein J2Y86_001091 [Pseudomonas migulae]|nr:hypothetical protein [Pseudomonas migulae]
MVVHATAQGSLAITVHGVGGHGNHRQSIKARLLANPLGGGVAFHFRYLAIHQHAVEVAILGQNVERLLAVPVQPQPYADTFQQLAGQLRKI